MKSFSSLVPAVLRLSSPLSFGAVRGHNSLCLAGTLPASLKEKQSVLGVGEPRARQERSCELSAMLGRSQGKGNPSCI